MKLRKNEKTREKMRKDEIIKDILEENEFAEWVSKNYYMSIG